MGMGDQLHALTAVLPGKWAGHMIHKAGWDPELVQTGMRKRKPLAPTGVRTQQSSLQQVATPHTLSPLPAIQWEKKS